MDKFREFLDENNPKNRKKSTLDLIFNNIRRLYNKCYGTELIDMSQIKGMILDTDHVLECLQSKWDDSRRPTSEPHELSVSTMLSYTNSIIATADIFNLDIADCYRILESELQVRREDHTRKNPVKTNKISTEELDIIVEDLEDKATTEIELRNAIMFHIVANYPFRCESASLVEISSNDYNKLDITNSNTNYLVVAPNSMMFCFNSYKTKKIYGCREIIVSEKLRDLFLVYLPMRKCSPQVFYPLLNKTEDKYQKDTMNNLSVIVKRIVKSYDVDCSLTDITKLLITQVWDNGSTEDKLRLAKERGHQIQTAAKVYATSR